MLGEIHPLVVVGFFFFLGVSGEKSVQAQAGEIRDMLGEKLMLIDATVVLVF